MKSLNILIVEDEALIAWDLKNKLSKVGYHIVGTFNNGKEALAAFQQHEIDLVLLDIHIIGTMDGIDVAVAIRQISDIPLIFLTAMSDRTYVERAKHVQPSAYLLKPYQIPALHIAIEMAIANFEQKQTNSSSPAATEHPSTDVPMELKNTKDVFLVQKNFAIIKPQKIFVKININEIYYIEADHVYTKLHTNTQSYMLRTPLQNILEKLIPFSFCRIHRSYAVNMNLVERFDDEKVLMSNQELPISKSHKADFMSFFAKNAIK
jgi:two-component system, response regulator PdtaR